MANLTEAQSKAIELKAQKAEAKAETKAKAEGIDHTNPFNKGVTYESFLETVPEGVSVKDFLKDKITNAEIAWIELELEHYKNN